MRFVLAAVLACGFSPASAQVMIQNVFEQCDAQVEAPVVSEVAGADADEDVRLELGVARQVIALECSEFMTFACIRQPDQIACLGMVSDLYLDAAMKTRGALVDLDVANPFSARRYQKWIIQSRGDVLADAVSSCGDMKGTDSWSALHAKYPNFTQDSYCLVVRLLGEYFQSLGWRKMGYEQGLLVAPD